MVLFCFGGFLLRFLSHLSGVRLRPEARGREGRVLVAWFFSTSIAVM